MAVSISISITQNSQSIANNTSNVTVKVTAKWTYGSYNLNSKSGWLKIDGTKYTFSNSFNNSQTTSGTKTLFTKTVDVSHNSDGTKKLSCSASYTSGVSSGTVTASASKTLTTIPRKSTLTVANGTLGTEQTLTISEKASAFYHKLTYSCGTASGYILGSSSATSSTLSTSWTPPLSLASQNTTGTTVSIKFTLYTYTSSSGTLIGSNSYTKTFSIPSSVKPTVSLSVADVYTYRTTYGAYVQGKSKLQIGITAAGSQGSTIKSYKTTIDGKTYSTASITTPVLAGSGTLTITTTVTDSRGRTATTTWDIDVLEYVAPKLTSLTAKRSGSGSASLTVTFGSEVTSLNSKNTATYTLQYKKTTETAYSDPITLPDYTGNYAVSGGTYTFAADTASSYEITLTVADAFDSVNKSVIGSSISKLWSILAKGKGIAIGKIAELANVFEVNFKSVFRKDVSVGSKTDYQDGKAGILLDSDGYIHVQRSSAEGYHPYIGFYIDDSVEISGQIRFNAQTGHIEFTSAEGYSFFNDVIIPNDTGIRTKDSNGNARHIIGMSTYNNCIVGYDCHANNLGNTHLYGMDIVSYSKNAGTNFRNYYRAGDSLGLNIHTAGYVTSSGTSVRFIVPLARPIVGSPTVTITSGSGMILRQNGVYTHGSSSTVYVKPTSYEWIGDTDWNAVIVAATLSSTTNVTNNDAISVVWQGNITLS